MLRGVFAPQLRNSAGFGRKALIDCLNTTERLGGVMRWDGSAWVRKPTYVSGKKLCPQWLQVAFDTQYGSQLRSFIPVSKYIRAGRSTESTMITSLFDTETNSTVQSNITIPDGSGWFPAKAPWGDYYYAGSTYISGTHYSSVFKTPDIVSGPASLLLNTGVNLNQTTRKAPPLFVVSPDNDRYVVDTFVKDLAEIHVSVFKNDVLLRYTSTAGDGSGLFILWPYLYFRRSSSEINRFHLLTAYVDSFTYPIPSASYAIKDNDRIYIHCGNGRRFLSVDGAASFVELSLNVYEVPVNGSIYEYDGTFIFKKAFGATGPDELRYEPKFVYPTIFSQTEITVFGNKVLFSYFDPNSLEYIMDICDASEPLLDELVPCNAQEEGSLKTCR